MTEQTAPQTGPRDGVAPHIMVGAPGAEAAIAWYARAFGAEVLARLPAGDGKRLMHACLRINGGILMLNDAFPDHGHPAEPPAGITLHLQVADAQAWWDRALAAGGDVLMPVDVQFWGDRYGQLRDPFGVRWSIGGPARA